MKAAFIIITRFLALANPSEKSLQLEQGHLIAFTNEEDCIRYLEDLHERETGLWKFTLKSVSFERLTEITFETWKPLNIDVPTRKDEIFAVWCPGFMMAATLDQPVLEAAVGFPWKKNRRHMYTQQLSPEQFSVLAEKE